MLNSWLSCLYFGLAQEEGKKEIGQTFVKLLGHLMPHEQARFFGLPWYDLQTFQLFAVALIVILFGGLVLLKDRRGRPWLWRVLAGWVIWIRDEMVYPQLGAENGRKWLPFFLTIFFFIMFSNLFGLLPPPLGGVTPTGSFFVTGALAALIFMIVLVFGMKEQGIIGFWKHLVPPGVPIIMAPLLFVVEVIGLFAKHIALMIRLWANMTGGHIVLCMFLGFIFLSGAMMSALPATGMSVIAVAFSAFIMIIEAFVALLQAYVFTLLAIIFIGTALHPEH